MWLAMLWIIVVADQRASAWPMSESPISITGL
jgi:hypothetical protein